MPFEFQFDVNIPADSRLIFPISMNQKYHTGERLEALFTFAEKYNSTILVADTLQKHNLGGDKGKALKQGDKFILKYQHLFNKADEIKSYEEWQEKKNSKKLKMIRWERWANLYPEELEKAKKIVEGEYKKKEDFFQSIEETLEKSMSVLDRESSIKYQLEEISYLLTFKEFDVHLYPKELNLSQVVAKGIFSDINIPEFLTPKLISKVENLQSTKGFFKASQKKRHDRSLQLAERMALKNIEVILNSPEVAPVRKEVFIEELRGMIDGYCLQPQLLGSVKFNP